jgi:hypothetical protein
MENNSSWQNHPARRMIWLSLSTLLFALFAAHVSAQPIADPVVQTYMQNLLQKYVQQDKDFDTFLENQSGLTTAEGTNQPIVINDLSKLPVPPNNDLQFDVNAFENPNGPSAFTPPMHMLWLPQGKIGAVFFDEGSGACLTYFLFRSDGKNADEIDTPDIFKPDVCGDEGGGAHDILGEEGFIVRHNDTVIALKFSFEELPPFDDKACTYTLSWEDWSGSTWSNFGSVKASSNSWHP